MPRLVFEGETHDEIVEAVRTWLASAQRPPLAAAVGEAVEVGSDLTRDALTLLARNAPEPLARNELVKGLVGMGHEANEGTRRAALAALDALSEASGGGLVKRLERARNSVVYEMNAGVAKHLLRALASGR